MKKWLFNPFRFVAGAKALAIGWAFIIVSAIIAFYTKTHFDGTFDVHIGAPLSPQMAIIEPVIDWSIFSIVLYIIGRLSSPSSIRLIDVLGTQSLARWPLLIVALLGFIYTPQNPKTLEEAMAMVFTPAFIIETVLSLPFIILTVALMYNAFAISTNLKGGKSAVLFITGIIIAEIVIKVILHYIE